MRNNNMQMTQRYLARFDEILQEMANKMLNNKMTNSITLNFIECMVPHHQAAIYMCENLLHYTSFRPLQEIARNIIKMQTAGIEQMKEIARTTPGFPNSMPNVESYLDEYFNITRNMIGRMKNSPRYISINLDFTGEMIPHHEGAISMCENLLKYYIDPRLKNVADTIIKEQSEGVKQLKQIQNFLSRR